MLLKRKDFINFMSLFILYFIQAMPFGFQSRYLPLVMRKQGVSITSLGLYKLLLLPWVCKFFIASLLVDVYKTKRFWLIVSLIILSIGSYLGMFINDFFKLALILLLLNFASASQDICVDWFAMNALKKEDLGIGNTIQVGGFKLGTLFSGGLLVYLMDYMSISQTFAILGTVYLISLLLLNLSFFNSEDKKFKLKNDNEHVNDNNSKEMSIKDRILLLHNSPGTYWICIFVFIYKLGEQSSLNLLPIYLLDRKVKSTMIGFWTGIAGQSFSILGSFLAGLILKKTNKIYSSHLWLKYIVFIRLIPIFLITFLVIQNETLYPKIAETYQFNTFMLNSILFFVQFQLFFSGILTTITFTIMMEISFMAPKSIQASHFSLIATCEVFGKLSFQPIISAFTDHFGYSYAFGLFSFLYLICLLNLRFRTNIIL